MTNEQKEILKFFNAYRNDGREVTLENAKKTYIFKERPILKRRFPEQLINDVFGEPSHLEKAEAMLLKIEEIEQDGQVDEELKRQNLIDIAYQISNACGRELDSNNSVWDKYAVLYASIPIEIIQYDKMPLWYPGLKKEIEYVTTEELEVAQNWFNFPEAKTDLVKREYLEYIFKLVHISLKKIFAEVKQEIMDKRGEKND